MLKDNEFIGNIGQYVLPITCDSWADITIVPEECVQTQEFTGGTCEVASFNRKISSGKTCDIIVTIGGRNFSRKAVAQPGADLGWSVCLSLPYREKADRNFNTNLMDQKFAYLETAKHGIPPNSGNNPEFVSPMVSVDTTDADTHADQGDDTVHTNVECQGEPNIIATEEVEDVRVEESAAEVVEKEMGDELMTSENNEAEGGLREGSAETEGEQDALIVEGIKELGQEPLLASETNSDPTVRHLRMLATM